MFSLWIFGNTDFGQERIPIISIRILMAPL